jgi:DNA modification methylase
MPNLLATLSTKSVLISKQYKEKRNNFLMNLRNHTRELLDENNFDEISKLISKSNTGEIRIILGSIGKLPKDLDSDLFFYLLDNEDEQIRVLAAKNLGKTLKNDELEIVKKIIQKEQASLVRRELYSAVGRLRHTDNNDILLAGLGEDDPKIIMQCIRGLLVHKSNDDISQRLLSLADHPNEIIRDVIRYELIDGSGLSQVKENHVASPPQLHNKLIHGDVFDSLSALPDECIHLTFTSPPYYNAKDYSFYKSYKEYLEFLEKIIKQIHRITKEGRFFILNTSPVIVPRFSRSHSSKRYLIPYDIHPRIIDLGFEFIEEIVWKKPEASAINRNGGFYQQRKPLMYKANHCTESVVVYRKKTKRLIDWNIAQYPDEIIKKSKVLDDDYFRGNVWEIGPSSSKVHPAIFPLELAKNVLRFYSMAGDLVLDPFAGVCTVAQAAQILERKFVMVDREKTYLEVGMKKLNNLFSGTQLISTNEL